MHEPLYMPLARTQIDRDYLSRNGDHWYDELLANPNAKAVVVHHGEVLVENLAPDVAPKLKLIPLLEAPAHTLAVYLGKSSEANDKHPIGTPFVLLIVDAAIAAELSQTDARFEHLRRSGAGLDDLEAGLFAQGVALANWHATHQYCPSCGGETQIEKAGWVRRCVRDGQELFPRTDPAIIVSVIDHQDRILLGSQGTWEDNRWSILAGFVEPGESLSAAVIREMYEEAGVHVENPIYLGSQAWPFPYSLMLGFTAKIRHDSDGTLIPDGDEITRLRWFSRDDIAAEAAELLLPGRMTISRMLIEHWYGSQFVSASENAN